MKAEDVRRSDLIERFFERKRDHFAGDHGFAAQPAIVWQCAPEGEVDIDIQDAALSEIVRQGAKSDQDDTWWCSFKADRRPTLVFDGIAAVGANESAGWTTEVHSDCHILAGVWKFPKIASQSGTSAPVIATFYDKAFSDFGLFASRVCQHVGVSVSLLVTCTMRYANQLALADRRGNSLAAAPNRELLRWPVQRVSTAADLLKACKTMEAQFFRTYGIQPPSGGGR